jgi:hypothetical protein
MYDIDELIPDGKVAKLLHKHIKTLPRWDQNERLKALGWPAPIVINGRKHRSGPKLKAFLKNAASAYLDSGA